MSEITIQKNTLFLLIALFAVIAIGFYFVSNPNQKGNTTQQNLVNNPSVLTPTQVGISQGGSNAAVQDVYLSASGSGYDKYEIDVKKGVPVRFHFTAHNAGCGSQLVIYGMNVRTVSSGGAESVIEFTPDKEGTFEYNCGMRMFPPGRFVVSS